MMLRFYHAKLSMLDNVISVSEALWVILDKLVDKTTVQFQSAVWLRSAVLHYYLVGATQTQLTMQAYPR